MAVWGAPRGSPRDPLNAVKACLEMRKALNDLNKRRIEKNLSPVLIGMEIGGNGKFRTGLYILVFPYTLFSTSQLNSPTIQQKLLALIISTLHIIFSN